MKKLFSLLAVAAIGFSTFGVFANDSVVHTQVSNKDAITWGYNNGVTRYGAESDFRANDPITREQAAKMTVSFYHSALSKLDIEENVGATCADFTDKAMIDETLLEEVNFTCNINLFKGFKGKFMPKNYINMSDARTILERATAFVPGLADHLTNVKLPTDHTFVTRGEFIQGLYLLNSIVDQKVVTNKDDMLKSTQTKLNSAKILRAQNKPAQYTLTQTVSCFCMQNYTRPMTYQVSNGAIVGSATYADGTGGNIDTTMSPTLNTVDMAFEIIQDAIDEKADNITVVFDATLGNPTTINIDKSRMMADEEKYMTFKLVK